MFVAACSTSSTTRYQIPHGGLFQLVAAPHYLGEIIEWTGFAVITASFPGTAFAVFTACNLVPRAVHHHRWNHQRWGETYRDLKRHAIFPFIL